VFPSLLWPAVLSIWLYLSTCFIWMVWKRLYDEKHTPSARNWPIINLFGIEFRKMGASCFPKSRVWGWVLEPLNRMFCRFEKHSNITSLILRSSLTCGRSGCVRGVFPDTGMKRVGYHWTNGWADKLACHVLHPTHESPVWSYTGAVSHCSGYVISFVPHIHNIEIHSTSLNCHLSDHQTVYNHICVYLYVYWALRSYLAD